MNLGESYNRLNLFNKAITACNKAMDLDWDLDRYHVNTWDFLGFIKSKIYKKKIKMVL